ncbi:MAG: HflK protein [Caedibacter sp. 37-49]|nr:MAG: HflK protein [Caedibacter sp. 37-49]
MPWQNNDGDKDHNPWEEKNDPWKSRKQGKTINLELSVEKAWENFKKSFSGQGGDKGRAILGLFVLILLLWLATGFYRVSEGELGVELRFGKMTTITQPGLRYHLPSPIEMVIVTKVSEINQVDSGIRVKSDTAMLGEDSDNQMLTGDENILTLNFSVLWFIKDVTKYLFNDPTPNKTVKLAAESAVREVIAQTTIVEALTKGKDKIVVDAQKLLQKMLDDYGIGIEVQQVRLLRVNPPEKVIDAFRDVQRARADRESKINEARAYQNSIIPEARGQAQQIEQSAEAFRQSVVADAQGQAQRFLALLKEYQKAPEVTRKRLYIDLMTQLMKNLNKVIIDIPGNGQSILPYLPLPAIKNKLSTASGDSQ